MKKIVNGNGIVKRPSKNAIRVAVLWACGVLAVGGFVNFAKARKNEMNVYSDVKNSDAYVEFMNYGKEKLAEQSQNNTIDTLKSMSKAEYDLNVGMSKEHFEKFATDEQKREAENEHIKEAISVGAGLVGAGVLAGVALKKLKKMEKEDTELEK